MPGPLVVTWSSRPNGPAVVYEYITNTNDSSPALRITAAVGDCDFRVIAADSIPRFCAKSQQANLPPLSSFILPSYFPPFSRQHQRLRYNCVYVSKPLRRLPC